MSSKLIMSLFPVPFAFQYMALTRPDLVVLMAVFGFTVGVIMTGFCFFCCIDRNASKVVTKFVQPYHFQRENYEAKMKRAASAEEPSQDTPTKNGKLD